LVLRNIGEVSMTQTDDQYNHTNDRYKEARDVWEDSQHRQEFEHDLINRKTTWSLTGQTILFAAYGVTLRSDFPDKANYFRNAVALAGLAVAIVTFLGVLTIIISKFLSWQQYRKFYPDPAEKTVSAKSNDSSEKLFLPRPLHRKKPLQWGVNTTNTIFTLAPEVLLPAGPIQDSSP
jgi:hypothetical protein